MIIRYIPIYEKLSAAKQALKEFLAKLKACPNLLTTNASEIGCDICSGPSVAKSKC